VVGIDGLMMNSGELFRLTARNREDERGIEMHRKN
jgi:hypothetical protein